MKIVNWNDSYLAFDDGSSIIGKHDQDCCEYNFADFDSPLLKGRDNAYEFDYYTLEDAEDGFVLILHGCPHRRFGKYDQRIYIPCYSYQNGYYSDEITICFDGAGKNHNQSGEWYLVCPIEE